MFCHVMTKCLLIYTNERLRQMMLRYAPVTIKATVKSRNAYINRQQLRIT